MPRPRRTPFVPGDNHCAVLWSRIRLEQLYLDLQQSPGTPGDLPEVQEAQPARLPARSPGTAPRGNPFAEPHAQWADPFAGEGDQCLKRGRHLSHLAERNRKPDRWNLQRCRWKDHRGYWFPCARNWFSDHCRMFKMSECREHQLKHHNFNRKLKPILYF